MDHSVCPECLWWRLGNCECVGKAHCIETLNCHRNALVQEHSFPRIGYAKRGSSAFFRLLLLLLLLLLSVEGVRYGRSPVQVQASGRKGAAASGCSAGCLPPVVLCVVVTC